MARQPENPDVDECVYRWFKQTHDKKIHVSRLLIRAKTEEFALKLEKGVRKFAIGDDRKIIKS